MSRSDHRSISFLDTAPTLTSCIAIIATLTLVEISLWSTLIVLGALLVFTWFGSVLCSYGRLASLGFATNIIVGIAVHIAVSQALLIANIDAQIAHWFTLLVLVTAGVMIVRRGATESRSLWDIDTSELVFAISIGLLAFSLQQPWLLPFGVTLVVFERALSRNKIRRTDLKFVGFTLLAGFGFLLSWALRPDGWSYFYLGGDTSFYESIGWITSEFGIFEHPGLSGGSIAGYHWFSYTFLGSLSHIAGLPPWDATTKIGVPFLLVTLAGLISHPPWRTAANKIGLHVWILTFTVLVGAAFIRYNSANFGMVAGLAFLSIVGRFYLAERTHLFSLVIVAIVSFTVIMSKATTGLIVGAGLCILAIRYWGRGCRFVLAPVIVFSAVGASTYLAFFRTSQFTEVGREVVVREPTAVLKDVFLGTPYFTWGALLVVMALTGTYGTQSEKSNNDFVRSLAVISVPVIALGLVLQHQQQLMVAAFFLTVVCAGWSLSGLSQDGDFWIHHDRLSIPATIGLALVSLLVGFSLPVVYNRLDRATNVPEIFGSSGWELTREIFPFVIPWLAVLYTVLRRTDSRQLLRFIAVIIVAMLLSGLTLDRARRATVWGPSVAVNYPLNDSPMPNNDLIAVGDHIRSVTTGDIILASNNFCCFGEMWWRTIADDLEAYASGELEWWRVVQTTTWWKELEIEQGPGLLSSLIDTQLGGKNYFLAADSRRRMLIQGLKHQTRIPNADQVNRMTLSLAFANAPDSDVVQELKAYGVSGFVVNLDLTDHRDWSQFASESFRSGNYVFLRLR